MKESIERYCIDELRRMADAHRRIANILFDLAEHATQPLLADTLREQVAANTWCIEQLESIFEILGIDGDDAPNAEVAVMVLEAGNEEDEQDPAVRDLMIVQSALRLQYYALANYAGLASWFQQLGHHAVGTNIDGMIGRIRMAEQHLEALQPSLTGLFPESGPHAYRTPAVARPRERAPRSDLDGYDR